MSAILSIAYFPPLDYFTILVKNSYSQIDIHETYCKQSYRNRCYIAGPNGVQHLTIPVIKPFGNHSKSKEILCDTKFNWRIQHWRSIETAYQNTAYFIYYKDIIKSALLSEENNLVIYNYNLLQAICKIIGISSPSFTDDFIRESESNYKGIIHPKKETQFTYTPYFQAFEHKYGFKENLSIIDLLFNNGPDTLNYLQQQQEKNI